MSDQKYRQPGYRDQEKPASSARSSVRPEREGPGGRGLGRPTHTTFRCRDCGTEAPGGEVGAEDACAQCGAALHSCVNCLQFDPSARFECRQPIEQAQRSKTKGNQCAFYEPKRVSELGSKSSDKPDSARSAFDDLFDF